MYHTPLLRWCKALGRFSNNAQFQNTSKSIDSNTSLAVPVFTTSFTGRSSRIFLRFSSAALKLSVRSSFTCLNRPFHLTTRATKWPSPWGCLYPCFSRQFRLNHIFRLPFWVQCFVGYTRYIIDKFHVHSRTSWYSGFREDSQASRIFLIWFFLSFCTVLKAASAYLSENSLSFEISFLKLDSSIRHNCRKHLKVQWSIRLHGPLSSPPRSWLCRDRPLFKNIGTQITVLVNLPTFW